MSKLLTQSDKIICENIVKLDDSINAKRAKALLLIDEGSTHSKAAEESNLSIGQVKYILTKYRSIGLIFFPDELIVINEETTPIIDTPKEIKQDKVEKKKSKVVKKTKKKEKKNKKDKKSKKTKSPKIKEEKKVKKKKVKKNKKLSKKKDKKKKKKK